MSPEERHCHLIHGHFVAVEDDSDESCDGCDDSDCWPCTDRAAAEWPVKVFP